MSNELYYQDIEILEEGVKLVNLYNKNYSVEEMEMLTGLTRHKIEEYLKVYELTYKNLKQNRRYEKALEIISEYEKCKDMNIVCEKFNISYNSFYRFIKSFPELEIIRKKVAKESLTHLDRSYVRKRIEKIYLEEILGKNIFTDINPDSAYWCGFIMTDGCVIE